MGEGLYHVQINDVSYRVVNPCAAFLILREPLHSNSINFWNGLAKCNIRTIVTREFYLPLRADLHELLWSFQSLMIVSTLRTGGQWTTHSLWHRELQYATK